MLWLVIDVDRWGDKKLSEVCREAKQRGYHLAVSHPCFEVWLYLHLDDLNAEDRNGGDFEKRIRQIIGSYNKSKLDLSKYQQTIHDAVNRAKQLHPDPSQNWPPSIGSHVYKLVEILMIIQNS
jgi:hypothetical protein